MIQLTSPAVLRQLLDEYGLAPHKQLGQNFLCDSNAIARIADASGVTERDAVLEIGPGLGTLTQQLAMRARKVVAVEIDSGLIPVLHRTLGEFDNVEIVHGDFLKCDLTALHNKLGGGEFRVAANLPYYITTPIIMGLLESGLPVSTMSFLIQKEVAQRMAAQPSSKSYGSLSIAVQYYTDVELVLHVSPGCFVPAPAVESVVIRLTRRPPKVAVRDEKLFFRLTRCAFAMRRKTLANNMAAGLGLTRSQAEDCLEKAGLRRDIRGEALTIEQFAALADAIAGCEEI